MTDQPLISVVIPTYNGAHLVTKAIESVKAQTYPHVEIIVCDDESKDNLDEVMQAYADDPFVHYVKHAHSGLPENRNIGLRAAQGDYIAFLDQDDMYQPEFLQRAYDIMQADPEIGMVYSGYNEVDTATGAVEYFEARLSGHVYERMIQGYNIAPSTVMVRRNVFNVVGLFHPQYQFGDDVDMWIRISQHFALAGIDEPLVTRRKHGDNMTASIIKYYEQQLILWQRIKANYPLPEGEYRKRIAESHILLIQQLYKAWPDILKRVSRPAILGYLIKTLYHQPGMIKTAVWWRLFRRALLPIQ